VGGGGEGAFIKRRNKLERDQVQGSYKKQADEVGSIRGDVGRGVETERRGRKKWGEKSNMGGEERNI